MEKKGVLCKYCGYRIFVRMNKNKIAIIGASYLQLPLVMKAKELGIETHCFAWDKDAVCKEVADFFYPISILEKEEILAKCKIIGINGIITIATDMAMPTISFVAQNLGLVSNSIESSILSTSKDKMRMKFQEKKILSPSFQQVKDYEDIDLKSINFPLIVKPVDRSGSLGVTKVEKLGELKEAVLKAIDFSFQKLCIVEDFIEGVEVSVESISWNGEHRILAITDKITTGEPFFVELAHHQPSQLSLEVQSKIKKTTLSVLDAVKIQFGAGHTELKITSDGRVFVIEVGGRMGGDFIGSHLVELSTTYDYIKAVIEVCLNCFELPGTVSNNAYSGVYFLSRNTERLAPYFEIENSFDYEKKILNEDLKYVQSSNDRSGYIIYKSDKRINI